MRYANQRHCPRVLFIAKKFVKQTRRKLENLIEFLHIFRSCANHVPTYLLLCVHVKPIGKINLQLRKREIQIKLLLSKPK